MSNQKFSSSALSIDQQVNLLKNRGLIINNVDSVKQRLATVSFHRLSAYCVVYETKFTDHQFKPNTTFDHIWNLYIFDRELRLLVLDVIERIEIALRTSLTNHLAVKYGECWYLDDSLFKTDWIQLRGYGLSPKEIFLKELNAVCKDKRHNETICRYYQKYDALSYPPSWIILEFLSFGKCTSLYRYLRSHQDKAAISKTFGVHHSIFESTLEPLRYTRNLCAHHSRLWDRWFVYKPKRLKELSNIGCIPGTLKEQLGFLAILLKVVSPESDWKKHLYELFVKYESVVLFSLAGFDEDWMSDLFWL